MGPNNFFHFIGDGEKLFNFDKFIVDFVVVFAIVVLVLVAAMAYCFHFFCA